MRIFLFHILAILCIENDLNLKFEIILELSLSIKTANTGELF